MPAPLCKCSNCGHVFESRAIYISGVRNATMTGNRETCSRCGGVAVILDGVFNASAEAMEVVKAPKLTRDTYEKFGQLIEQAKHQKMPPDEFVKRAEAIAPEVGDAAKKIASSKVGYAVALGIFLVMLKSCNFNVDINFDVNKAIETYIERSNDQKPKI